MHTISKPNPVHTENTGSRAARVKNEHVAALHSETQSVSDYKCDLNCHTVEPCYAVLSDILY